MAVKLLLTSLKRNLQKTNKNVASKIQIKTFVEERPLNKWKNTLAGGVVSITLQNLGPMLTKSSERLRAKH